MSGASAIIGVIEPAQTRDGRTERNNRLIAIESHIHSSLKSLGMPDSELIKEIEHFLVSSTCGPLRAIGLNFFSCDASDQETSEGKKKR